MEPASRTKRPSKNSHKPCPLASYYNNCSITRTNRRQRETITVQKNSHRVYSSVSRSRASNKIMHTLKTSGWANQTEPSAANGKYYIMELSSNMTQWKITNDSLFPTLWLCLL